MAVSKIQFIQQDGNLFTAQDGQDHISALVFDVTTFPTSGTNTGVDGDVYEVFSLKEAEALGFNPFTLSGVNYETGVPHYHISEFFRLNPRGHLFVGVKNMAAAGNFDFLADVQRVANGRVRQVGVYTKQALFTAGALTTDPYTLNLVPALQTVATLLETENRPLSILLQANTTNVSGNLTVVSKLPEILTKDAKNVSVLLGQGNSAKIKDMQKLNGANKAVVGCVGTALACVANAGVGESIAWVAKFNLAGAEMDTVAFGFGDTTDESGTSTRLKDNTPYEMLSTGQLDNLEDKGYIFPVKYTGNAGTYFSSDKTATDGDFRTIARNRAIDKSKRMVRTVLLPTLNETLLVDATTGFVATNTIMRYKSIVGNVLATMKPVEISDFRVYIDAEQNALLTDQLVIRYSIVPLGTNHSIQVEVGFTQKLIG